MGESGGRDTNGAAWVRQGRGGATWRSDKGDDDRYDQWGSEKWSDDKWGRDKGNDNGYPYEEYVRQNDAAWYEGVAEHIKERRRRQPGRPRGGTRQQREEAAREELGSIRIFENCCASHQFSVIFFGPLW